MIYLLVFVCGMFSYGFIIPLFNILLECIETKKEVFVSNQSVIISTNNTKIQKAKVDESSASAIGFECSSSDEDDEEYKESQTDMDRKVGF